ncbi:hypothetical protein [Candidatus Poriferisodalis sp.]|uniref:hypothetical protein n=1 Tax=Candidatus Poriferisodalis sp. TaxID=3101277 RepID=UPI003B58E5B3
MTQLEELRRKIAADPCSLREASDRLRAVLDAAGKHPDALRTYRSGSLASRFTNRPVDDADGGLVIDRRKHPALGPDGDGELPRALVDNVHNLIRPLLVEQYPCVRIEKMKRGLLVRFNEPLPSGEDPTVDLVVALNRVEAPGLWIPNLDRNRWDPSDPERHVELFTSGWPELRHTRQHVVRVAKAHAKQFSEPAVCSFNIAALAWECIELVEPLDRALQRFFAYAATSLAQHLTADPAGVSAAIKVADRNRAVQRFRKVADALDLAIEAGDDDAKVYEILAATGVFWKLVDPPTSSIATIQQAIASGDPMSITKTGALVAGATFGVTSIKPTRSYGGHYLATNRRRRSGPWYGRFVDRLRFEGDTRRHVIGLQVPRRPSHGGVRYRWDVAAPGCERRRVRIDFRLSSPGVPRVYVDGPTESPHRYEDGSLCMWYPGDPLERRWSFGDGLHALLGQIAVHLVKEHIWRQSGEWSGAEVPHGAEAKAVL